jgi:hypothetical protein
VKLIWIALCLSLAACNPYLTQQSVAPPGRSARLDEVNGFWGLKHYRLEISEGVALALTCNRGAPCEKTTVISDDRSIAEVRPASLSALQPVGLSSQLPASAFVVIGKAPGTTKLHVKAKEGTRDVFVTVVAPPAPANTQSAAK